MSNTSTSLGTLTKVLDGGTWKEVEKVWIMDGDVWKPIFKTTILDGTWKEAFKLKGSQMTLSSSTRYTTNATFTIPQGTRYIKAFAAGAGGGGGGAHLWRPTPSTVISPTIGAGGGTGSTATSDLYEVKPGNVLTIEIGQGGGKGTTTTAVNAGVNNGSAGGASYVSIGASAPNGISSGTVIARGNGGGGGGGAGYQTGNQYGAASTPGATGSYSSNNTHNEGTGSTGSSGSLGGIGGRVELVTTPNFSIVPQITYYSQDGSNGYVDIWLYQLANIS